MLNFFICFLRLSLCFFPLFLVAGIRFAWLHLCFGMLLFMFVFYFCLSTEVIHLRRLIDLKKKKKVKKRE